MDEKVKEIQERYGTPKTAYASLRVMTDINYILSLLEEKKKKIEELEKEDKVNLESIMKKVDERDIHLLKQAEARIKELEDGIEKHRFITVGIVNWKELKQANEELYKLIKKV